MSKVLFECGKYSCLVLVSNRAPVKEREKVSILQVIKMILKGYRIYLMSDD